MCNTSIIDTGFILGTCVVKPDYCRGNDWLGISHRVTHRRSPQKAHVHHVNQERKNGRKRGKAKQEGDGRMNRKHRGGRQESDDNNYMERVRKRTLKKREAEARREKMTNKQARAVKAQAPPAVSDGSTEASVIGSLHLRNSTLTPATFCCLKEDKEPDSCVINLSISTRDNELLDSLSCS